MKVFAFMCTCVSPQVYMVEQVFFEHPAPSLDDIHQCVLEGSDV